MSIKITGLNKLQKKLKQMEKGVKDLNQIKHLSFENLFPPSFMRKCSSFSSMDELLKVGGFKVETTEEFEAIPGVPFDKHIAATTNFKCWEDMLSEATSQYAAKKLGF